LDSLVLGFDFLAPARVSFRPIWKSEHASRSGRWPPPRDRITSRRSIAWVMTSFRQILPIAEQVVNDYGLFAICLG
jgi:hypothetical protein